MKFLLWILSSSIFVLSALQEPIFTPLDKLAFSWEAISYYNCYKAEFLSPQQNSGQRKIAPGSPTDRLMTLNEFVDHIVRPQDRSTAGRQEGFRAGMHGTIVVNG